MNTAHVAVADQRAVAAGLGVGAFIYRHVLGQGTDGGLQGVIGAHPVGDRFLVGVGSAGDVQRFVGFTLRFNGEGDTRQRIRDGVALAFDLDVVHHHDGVLRRGLLGQGAGAGRRVVTNGALQFGITGYSDGHRALGAGGLRGQHQAVIAIVCFNDAGGHVAVGFVDRAGDTGQRGIRIGQIHFQRLFGARLADGDSALRPGNIAEFFGVAGNGAGGQHLCFSNLAYVNGKAANGCIRGCRGAERGVGAADCGRVPGRGFT